MTFSFICEDLISQVQTIQNRAVEIENILADRCKNKIPDELKSRSLTFIDPYGNHMTDKYFDHELINNVIRKYKKNYVPKYLQLWIKFGTMKEKKIAPLTDCELKSTVADFANDYQFITYGQVTVWFKGDNNSSYETFKSNVLLMDNLEKIKTQILEQQHFTNIESKLCMINEDKYPNEKYWNEGTTLNLDDTVMSRQLYKNGCVVMAKISKEKVKHCLSFQIILFFFSSACW
jgi:hypothetical protein